jgi:DNA repair exonuclease SbcCD nuclease subunit
MEKNEPTPDPSRFNIFVFHMTLDIPKVRPPQMEAEASLDMIPDDFDYYAGGHIHKPYKIPTKGGILVYSGCTETVDYEDAEIEKGFYHVEVDNKGKPTLNRIKLETPRRFIILDRDYTGSTPARITETAVRLVAEADETGAVIIPVLKGALPAEASRGEIDLAKIRDAAKEALLVRPVLRLRETAIPEEVIRSIFTGELKDLKTKAFEYFFEIFSERRSKEEVEELAKLAVNLIQPLVKKEETKVKEELEASPRES